MKLLTDLFREKVSSNKDFRMKNETEQDIAYPTGFLAFDFLNGTVIHVKSETVDFTYNSVGIIDGSMVTVIGRSGCGKTTFILQAAAEIIKPYQTSCIYHDDIEGGIVQSRKEFLTSALSAVSNLCRSALSDISHLWFINVNTVSEPKKLRGSI